MRRHTIFAGRGPTMRAFMILGEVDIFTLTICLVAGYVNYEVFNKLSLELIFILHNIFGCSIHQVCSGCVQQHGLGN